MADMLRSFAEVVTLGNGNYCRPTFGDTLAVQQGRHPVLHRIDASATVPNDTFMQAKESNLHVIQGPNMSGKSIYLKQVALLQILAQIGSFVPAVSASFRISDQIFTRLGLEDCADANSSTFQLECDEINYILQNVSGSSLVLLDEVGRGTSPQEGAGMCHALSEFLALKTEAFTLMATHFNELTRLAEYPSIDVFHMEVRAVSSGGGASAASAAAASTSGGGGPGLTAAAKLKFTHSLKVRWLIMCFAHHSSSNAQLKPMPLGLTPSTCDRIARLANISSF
jgi:DNA mismatch repair protein MSH4